MRGLVLVGALAVSCGDALPCTSCPDLTGAYLASWRRLPGTEACGPTPQPVTLSLTQVGSLLRSSLGNAALRGTLYDTNDLTLSGGLSPSWFLKARAETTLTTLGVDGGRLDGGTGTRTAVRLRGTLTASAPDWPCTAREELIADRVTP